MVRRCPSCGTVNSLEARACEKCGNSFEEQVEKEILAVKDIRVYSLFVLIMSLVSTAQYVLSIVDNGSYTSSGLFSMFSGLNAQGFANQLTVIAVVLEFVAVLSILLQIISIIYLRAGFRKIVKGDYEFSTPITGTTLLIVGLILGMIGIVIVLALIVPFLATISQGSTPVFNGSLGGILAGGLLAALGGLLILIGYILGVLLGLHRLASRFEQPYFDYGWILLIISLFFSPLSIVAGFLLYKGSTSTAEMLKSGPKGPSQDLGWT